LILSEKERVSEIVAKAAVQTAATSLIRLVWHVLDPNLLKSSEAWVFMMINLTMLTATGAAGHIGGKLVFKD